MIKRIHIIVKGRVQGVFFRDFTQKKAAGLGLKGIVRNRRDGTVEVEAQGDAHQLDELVKWCWQGSPMSHVNDVITNEITHDTEYPDFRVVY